MKKVFVLILSLIMIFSVSGETFATDSYSNYFSEEREFTVVDNALDYSTYLYSDEETGYLYSRNVDTKEERLIYDKNVTNHYVWGGNIYCVVDGNSIVKIAVDGSDPETILTTEKDIEQLYVDNDIIFYLANNVIYRYHRASEITDIIASDKNIYFFYPYTNFTVEYGDGSENQEIKRTCRATRSAAIVVDEYSFMNFSVPTQAASSVTVHGKTIPYSTYSDGTYFNKTGTRCSCHTSATKCPYGLNCNICMVVTGNNGKATQCHAFGCSVYKYIWGAFGTKNNYDNNPVAIDSESKAREMFWKLPAGTMVRAYYKGSAVSNHTFVITDVNSTGVTIYEANNPGYCIVSYKSFSFAQVAKSYSKIAYTYTGNHSFGTDYGYDDSVHWNKCTTSRCAAGTNFAYHNLTTNAQGIISCTVCRYVDTSLINGLEASS